jgi:beta-xylosidase
MIQNIFNTNRKEFVRSFYLALSLTYMMSLSAGAQTRQIHNPILPGYFADPTIIKEKGIFYIYATIDPWGGNELAVFETTDFIHFTRRHINWPTKKACTSPTTSDAMVWAPSVVKGKDGKFYMYVSVGSEVWAGVAEKPLGTWKNIKPNNTPLIKHSDFPLVHNIDADCFVDDDGSAYLYWGSGFDWVNGHCMAVKLKDDMCSFETHPVDVTPPQYFEGPHMMKRHGIYYLMFSSGKAIDATYCVGYATSKSPLGPFIKGANSPILKTTPDSTTIGPGHHTTFIENDKYYILYHRIFPQKKELVLRQLCLDSLQFDQEGNLLTIIPSGISWPKKLKEK